MVRRLTGARTEPIRTPPGSTAAMGETTYETPYTPYPGSSTPPASVTPHEGKRELWGFFWLALLNTLIIAVAGIVTWWFFR